MKRFLKASRPRRKYETWQIIYIDLMTNVMIFFVILWSINQGKKIKITQTVGDHTSRTVNLPGDVIFPQGKTFLNSEGKSVFKKLFSDETGAVLNFEGNALAKRLLVIHGHTDSDGKKDDNFQLGFNRALSAYKEIRNYTKEIPEHVVLCTHADNNPVEDVPAVTGKLTPEQKAVVASAKAKNRRITIEDSLVSHLDTE